MKNYTGCRKRAATWSRILATAAAATLMTVQGTAAQDDSLTYQPPAAVATSPHTFGISGELGTFGESYGISGRERRRPSSTGRMYLRSTWTAWGSISGSLNLMLSNEGNSARQDINNLDFNPRWRWGSAHLGDFSEELSPLTLSGVKIRGGALMLTPAKWRIALLGGLTNRAVSEESSSRSYERSISGIGLGYGSEGGTSVDLFILNARDRLSSLAELPRDTLPPDTALIDTSLAVFEQDPITITPQENLVVSLAMNLAFLQRRLSWRHEISGSAITRDRRSAELDDSDVPEFLADLFVPRKSSSADFAYTSDLRLDLRRASITTGLHYVGPGYASLGVASLMSDKQEFTAGVLYRLRQGIVRVDGALQRDNLIDQKRFTTDRLRINSLVSYRLRPAWNVTAGVTYIGMANDAISDTTRIDYGSWILRTGQQLTFRRERGLRSLSLDLLYQHASDANPLRQSAAVDCNSGSITAITGISASLEMNSAVALITARSGSGVRTFTQNYSLSLRHIAMGRRLVSSVAITVAVGDVTTSIRPRIRSGYEFGSNLSVTAELEATSIKGGSRSSQFDEIAGRLMFARRF